MTETQITAAFFLFVMAVSGAALLLFTWRLRARPVEPAVESAGETGGRELWPTVIRSMRFLGTVAAPEAAEPRSLRSLLIAAGYRSPQAATVFHGVRVAAVIAMSLGFGWLGLLARENIAAGAMLALSGAGLAFILPERLLRGMAKRRVHRLERALPSAVDLMVLSLESGQSMDSALFETGRELGGLYPDLAAEFSQVHLEMRAGRSRADVLADLAARTRSRELRKFSSVLIDSDRFGTSLAPALRTHARYLRIRRRQEAQEAARKLTTKMVFPIFFLIMPSVFVITLGPALLQMAQAFSQGIFK